MQIIEIILFLTTFVMFLIIIKYKTIKKQYTITLIGLSVLLFLLHIIFENIRWQLYPLYLAMFLGLVILALNSYNFYNFQDKKITRRTSLSISVVLLAISGFATFVFPVSKMPTPSGNLPIGTESFILTDPIREEAYGEAGMRKIKVQFWYPAKTTDNYDLVPWLEDGKVVAQSLAKSMNLPSFILNHTELIMSNSYKEAPIDNAQEQYPVVIISHGWKGFRNLHTDLAEELASLGYVVVGIDHTYGSVATYFSDEEIRYLNLDALPSRETHTDFLAYANQLVNTYAGDITLTIDQLENMNSGDIVTRFRGKLDLTNIGLLGHSTGAGAGAAVALSDSRIKALIGMDAWVEPIYQTEIDKKLNMPSLFLRSGSWETGINNTNLLNLVNQSNGPSELYQIDGTTHSDFSMAYMYSPLTKTLGITGKLSGDELLSIYKSMFVTFFDEHLKRENTGSLSAIDDLWEALRKIE